MTTLNAASSRKIGQSRLRCGLPPQTTAASKITRPPIRVLRPAKIMGGECSKPTFTTEKADPQNRTSKAKASTTYRRLPKSRKVTHLAPGCSPASRTIPDSRLHQFGEERAGAVEHPPVALQCAGDVGALQHDEQTLGQRRGVLRTGLGGEVPETLSYPGLMPPDHPSRRMIGVRELRGAVNEGATPHLSRREILPVGIADSQEPVARSLATRKSLLQKLPPAPIAVLQVGGHEIFLGGEVGVEGHLRNPGPLGHRADPGGADATPVEELAGGGQQPLLRLGLVPRPHRFFSHSLTIPFGIVKHKNMIRVAKFREYPFHA